MPAHRVRNLPGPTPTEKILILLVVPLSAQDARLRNKVELQGQEPAEQERAATEERAAYRSPLLEGAVDPERYILGPYDQLLINLVGPEPCLIADVRFASSSAQGHN